MRYRYDVKVTTTGKLTITEERKGVDKESNMAALSFTVPFKYAALVALIGFSLAAVSDGCTSKDDCEVNQVCCDSECVDRSSCAGRYCSSDYDCSSQSGESCCGHFCVSSSSCVGLHCSYDSDCSRGEICCGHICVSSSGCVGHYCSSDSDCYSGESCCRHSCVSGSGCLGQFCSFDSDCSTGESCCWRHSCVSGSGCVGRKCLSDFDCSGGESCCSSECKNGSGCIGFSCSIRHDCGNSETCCHGTCHPSCNSTTAVTAGTVIGVLVFVCMISILIFYAWHKRRTLQGRVILGQSATATSVTPRQGHHPYYPLPQYEQQQEQTANPPPYNPETVAGSEQLPPYPTKPLRESGGVYAPQDTILSATAV